VAAVGVLAGLSLGVANSAQAKSFIDYIKPAPIVCSPLPVAAARSARARAGRSAVAFCWRRSASWSPPDESARQPVASLATT